MVSEWTSSDNNRRAKFYRLTRAGHEQLEKEASEWRETTEVMARFLSLSKGEAGRLA